MIPYGRQDISDDDIAAVIDVLRSDFLTQGPVGPLFEAAVARHCGAEYGIAVNSATSALHIACLALGVGPGDWVWTSPITFVASANCALYCGAQVDFVDIDPRTYNMSVDCLAEKLERAQREGQLPKVLIPVHLAGQSCEMASIHKLALEYGFKIVEDASHAIGGKYQGESIGCSRYSDITVFSFHPVKIITTAEGGMSVTNDPQLARRMRLFRSHGITREPSELTHEPDGPWYYQQIELGYNYRMTDLHAALGLSQMDRLDAFVSRRHELSDRYDELLAPLPVEIPFQHPSTYSALHLYIVRVRSAAANPHAKVFEALRASGVGANLHYIPVYRQPYYEGLGFRKGYCVEAEKYYAEAITLPLYAALTESQQDHVVRAVQMALSA